MLSTWLCYADLVRLCERCVLAERTGHCVIWAASDNPATFWGADHRDRIGWAPRDSAEAFRGAVGGKVAAIRWSERYQGGDYTAAGYSRDSALAARRLRARLSPPSCRRSHAGRFLPA